MPKLEDFNLLEMMPEDTEPDPAINELLESIVRKDSGSSPLTVKDLVDMYRTLKRIARAQGLEPIVYQIGSDNAET